MDGEPGVGRKPIPRPGFLDTCEYLGYSHGERRWRDRSAAVLYTWDDLHGEIEIFNLRGRHLGVADPMTGDRIKPARKGRRIHV
jgi:hypothetical protein